MKQELAERYGELEQWHWWFRGRQRILEHVLQEHLGGRTGLSVASLGCGPIEGLGWLLPMAGPGGRVIGIDLDAVHARRTPWPLSFILGRFESIPLQSESCDVVLALDVLEHIEDDVAGLREAIRLLRPQGLLLVTVPALPSLWGGHDVMSQHVKRYTEKTLQSAFARAGASLKFMTYFNTLLFPPVAAIRWARRAFGLHARAHSDFEHSRPGLVNDLLMRTFSCERHVVGRWRLPIGVSLLAVAQC